MSYLYCFSLCHQHETCRFWPYLTQIPSIFSNSLPRNHPQAQIVMPDTASDTIPNEQPATPAERVISELHLSSHDVLANCERTVCPAGCGKHRRYYCCDCLVPCISHDQSSTTDTTPAIPNVSLPLHVHLFQAGAERPQQSTAQHVALLAPDYATLWRPFPECADLFREKVLDKAPPDSIALLYVTPANSKHTHTHFVSYIRS